MATLDHPVGDNHDRDDDDNDKVHKVKKRVRRAGTATSSSSRNTSCSLPTSIVCSPTEVANRPGAIEAGVIVSLLVLALYGLGCYETFVSLPDVPQMPHFRDHMGENLNLALNAFDSFKKLPLLTTRKSKEAASGGKVGRTDNTAQAKDPKQPQVVSIPTGVWPVSVKTESSSLRETIVHPGDRKTPMEVPTFWSRPIHQGGLMTRETAMKIGTCVEPDPSTGSYVRGDDCPVDQRTIFIQIASYRDFQCRLTVESAFSRAKNPDRIRVGVVDQIVSGDDVRCDEPIEPCDTHPDQALCKYKDRIDVYEMRADLSVGPVFARHIGYRLYRGEYYATQSDAHVSFTVNWDQDIISQLEASRNEMAVLSTYLTDVQGSIDAQGRSTRKTRPIMCNTAFEGGPQGMHLRHGSQPEKYPSLKGEPQLSPWWAAGYSFSRGHFVVNVPYDLYQPMIFQGEEMSIGIRGYTIGYDFYAPERSVCFHHYAVGKNAAVRNKVHHFWENDNQYAGTGKRAMARLLGIVRMNPEIDVSQWDHTEEDVYGLGGVRTPEQFYKTYGINVKKKTSEGHLCKFVDADGQRGPMHTMFTKFLRPDGMGIDYSKIKYQWRDPEGVQVAAEPTDDTEGKEEEKEVEEEEEEEAEEEEGEGEKEGDDSD